MLEKRTALAAISIAQMLTLAVGLIFWPPTNNVFSQDQINMMPIALGLVQWLLLILFIISSIKRCRALNLSAWRILAYPIPVAGLILFIMLLLKPPSPNIGKGGADS